MPSIMNHADQAVHVPSCRRETDPLSRNYTPNRFHLSRKVTGMGAHARLNRLSRESESCIFIHWFEK